MSINSKMTALADEIRELSGTITPKSLDAMTSDVDAANTEITEQAGLLAQIQEVVDSLPEAGGGGSTDEKSYAFLYSPYQTVTTPAIVFNSGDTWADYIDSINNIQIAPDGETCPIIFDYDGYVGFYFFSYNMQSMLNTTVLQATISDVIQEGVTYELDGNMFA